MLREQSSQRATKAEREGDLDDLYTLCAGILKSYGKENHIKTERGEEVFWQTEEFLTDDDGEIRVVTVETIPMIPDSETLSELNNPRRRIAIFERLAVQVIKRDADYKIISKLLIGSFGRGVDLLKTNDGQEEHVEFPIDVYNQYKKLAQDMADALN